jgi:multidrug efflux pump subunit AcrA (membrane-fusion protein)
VVVDDVQDHGQPGGDNDHALAIDFSSLFAAQDGDGDTVNLPNGTFTVIVNDDAPMLSDAAPITESIDEGTSSSLTGTLAEQIVGGADDNVRFVVEDINLHSSLTGLKSGGHPVEYSISEDEKTLVATADGKTVFTFTVDPNTGTLAARAELVNPNRQLLPGFFVRVRVPLEEQPALLVPTVALGSDQARLQ